MAIQDLQPATIIKRVMDGNTDKEYLEAFSKLSITDLHSPNDTISVKNIYKLWNKLQSTPSKRSNFTFSLVNHNKFVQSTIKEMGCKYAWILHDKDNAEHNHYHYYLEFPNPRSFKSLADDLELPVTMLEKVYSKKGILQYLTHDNDPNKHHYDQSEVVTNFDLETEKYDDNNDGPDIQKEWELYCAFRRGDIPPQVLIDYLKNISFATLNVNNRFRMYESIFNSSEYAGSSYSDADCRLPKNSRASPYRQPNFAINDDSITWIHNNTKLQYSGSSPEPNKNRTNHNNFIKPKLNKDNLNDQHFT